MSIEKDQKNVESAIKGEEVSIKVAHLSDGNQKLYGRHFDHKDALISDMTRDSIDILKDYFRDEMTKKGLWGLVKKLKVRLGIP